MSNKTEISYSDALRLKIDKHTSVAGASISAFRAFVMANAVALPGAVKHELALLDFSYLPDRWQALCMLIENGVSIDQSS